MRKETIDITLFKDKEEMKQVKKVGIFYCNLTKQVLIMMHNRDSSYNNDES